MRDAAWQASGVQCFRSRNTELSCEHRPAIATVRANGRPTPWHFATRSLCCDRGTARRAHGHTSRCGSGCIGRSSALQLQLRLLSFACMLLAGPYVQVRRGCQCRPLGSLCCCCFFPVTAVLPCCCSLPVVVVGLPLPAFAACDLQCLRLKLVRWARRRVRV